MGASFEYLNNTSPAPLGQRARYSIMTTLDSERTQISAESYFKTQPPPPTLEHDIASVRSFIHRQRDLGNKVVLVTVSIRPRASLCRLERLTHSQERRDDCPFGAQCVSSILCITARLPSPPDATFRVRFLDNFSAGESLVRASMVSGSHS